MATPSVYQRVGNATVTASDYDSSVGKVYLRFNGTNQWLQTNSIDFTYGDKMFVSAGVSKLSDAAASVLAEFSASTATNNGSFGVFAPLTSGYSFRSKGTTDQTSTSTVYAAPITNIFSGIGGVQPAEATLRINGSQVAANGLSQGTGNYGNYPLYIGARAGSSLWFNGRLYGMVVTGKSTSTSEITNTENYLNQKTGAY